MKICSIDSCHNNIFAKGMCNKHYKQMYRYGKILERTIYDKNEIIKYDDYAEMKLYDKYGSYTASTIIDIDDVEIVSKYKWYLNSNGYIRCTELNEYLHRFVLNAKSEDVDHIYHDPLDNRKNNLRECNHYENNRNSNKTNSNIGIKGVYYIEKFNKFYASINSEGVKYTSKYYEGIADAINSREIMELYLHKEFSPKYNYLLNKHGNIDYEIFENIVTYRSNYNMKG